MQSTEFEREWGESWQQPEFYDDEIARWEDEGGAIYEIEIRKVPTLSSRSGNLADNAPYQ